MTKAAVQMEQYYNLITANLFKFQTCEREIERSLNIDTLSASSTIHALLLFPSRDKLCSGAFGRRHGQSRDHVLSPCPRWSIRDEILKVSGCLRCEEQVNESSRS
jgi:hypothetical protein